MGFCFVAFDKRPGDGPSFTQASHGKIRGGVVADRVQNTN